MARFQILHAQRARRLIPAGSLLAWILLSTGTWLERRVSKSWTLGDCAELRDRIIDEIRKPPAVRDDEFCDQIRDSARSAPRNISEGFGAYRPREFARLVRIARRSLLETRNHLLEGTKAKYFVDPAARELFILCRRATGATTALLRYLEGCDGIAPTDWT